jgi:hypothetical protein
MHQQVELGRRQMCLDASPTHAPFRPVYLEIAHHDGHLVVHRRTAQTGAPLDPAQQRVHPRRQLPHRERLGEIVVGANGETDQEIGFVVAGGQHEHTHRSLRLNPPAHLEAVEPGQHDVEYHQVGLVGIGPGHRGRPVVRDRHVETFGPQPGGHRFGDRPFVLHHQNPPLACAHGGQPKDHPWRSPAHIVNVSCADRLWHCPPPRSTVRAKRACGSACAACLGLDRP